MTEFIFKNKNSKHPIHITAEHLESAFEKLEGIIKDTKIKTANIDNWILQTN